MALLLTLKLLGTLAVAIDETKPYGMVCVAVLDSTTRTEVSLTKGAKSGPGHRVIAHLDANTACEAIVAAFSKTTGGLVNGWRPVLLTLAAWDEKTVPLATESWTWLQPLEPFEIYTVFLPKGTSGCEKVRNLIAKLRDLKTKPSIADLQSRQLCQELIKWSALENEATAQKAAATKPEGGSQSIAGTTASTWPDGAPQLVGGTVRTADEFPWRVEAWKRNFLEAKPSVIVFQHAGK